MRNIYSLCHIVLIVSRGWCRIRRVFVIALADLTYAYSVL